MLFSSSAISPSIQGKVFLALFTWFSFIYCLYAGAESTSDCISQEKREGTLGLLFLTDLKTFDLLIGKIAATSLRHIYTLLAVVPMLALCLLMGGVTGKEILYIAVMLLNTLFFSVSAGALISTFSLDHRKAMFGSILLIFACCGLPLVADFYAVASLDRYTPENGILFLASPAYPAIVTVDPRRFNDLRPLISMITIHLESWLFLFIACRALPSRVNETARGTFTKWQSWKKRVFYGSAEDRAAYRRRLLDQNAYYWMAAQEKLKAVYSWSLVLAYIGLILLAWFFGNDLAANSPYPVAMFLFFHGFYKCWIASEVSFRLVEDRRVGAFELLLSTSVTTRDLAAGLNKALWRQFCFPLAAMLVFDLFLFQSILTYGDEDFQIFVRLGFPAYLAIFFLDIFSLKWLAAWNSLFTNKQGLALSRLIGQVLALPWILSLCTWLLLLFLDKILAPKTGFYNNVTMLASWIGYSLIVSILPAWHARKRFLTELRDVAANRFDPSDKGGFLQYLYSHAAKRKNGKAQPVYVRHWALTSMAILILGLSGFFMWRSNSWHRQFEARLSQLKAKNVPVNSRDLAAMRPFVRPDQDGAVWLRQALLQSAAITTSPGLSFRDGLLNPELQLGSPLPSLVVSNLSLLEKRNQSALKILSQLTNYTEGSFLLDWAHPWGAPYNQTVQSLQQLSDAAQSRALVDIERGDLEVAARTIEQLLLISKFTSQTEGFNMEHFRRALLNKSTEALERLFSAGIDSKSPAIRRIAILLPKLENEDHVRETLNGLRAMVIERCNKPISTVMTDINPFGGNPIWGFALQVEKNTGSYDRQLCKYLDHIEAAFKILDMDASAAKTEAARSLDRAWDEDRGMGPFFHPVVFFIPYFDWLITEQTRATTKIRLMQALILAEEAGGHADVLPAVLSSPACPKDPYSKAPFKWIKTSKGYSIYSVGPDLTDNQGSKPKSSAQKTGFDYAIRVIHQGTETLSGSFIAPPPAQIQTPPGQTELQLK
jgi:hypothetical protein